MQEYEYQKVEQHDGFTSTTGNSNSYAPKMQFLGESENGSENDATCAGR